MTEILNPNCSEVVWKLNNIDTKGLTEFMLDSSSSPVMSETLEQMINLLQNNTSPPKNNVSPKIVGDYGGSYGIKELTYILGWAKKVVKGIVKKQDAIDAVNKYENKHF